MLRIVERFEAMPGADSILEEFRGSIGGYRRLPNAVVAGQIRAVLQGNIALFVRLVREAREPSDQELEAFRLSAVDRATEGMPLEDVLHAYRLGGIMAWRMFVQAQGEDQAALIPLAEMLMGYVDRVSASVAQAYLEERQHLVSEHERRLRQLLDELGQDGPLGANSAELARALGFPVQETYRPFSCVLREASSRAHSSLAVTLRARGLLAVTEGARVTGLLGAEQTDAEPGDGVMVVGPQARTSGTLGGVLEDVRLAVDIAARRGLRGVLTLDAVLPELLLARSPGLAQALHQAILEPLQHQDERANSGDLELTLRAYLSYGMDRAKTAAELHVHPNTLDHRLRRVSALTGLNLARTDDLLRASLALERTT